MAPPPLVSCRLFFVANRKVCEDWYAQLRSSLVWCAAVAEDPAALLYHSSATLAAAARATKATGSDADEAWRHAAQLERQIAAVATVLCNDCAHASSLTGLGAWARLVLGDTCLANDPAPLAGWMPWLSAAVLDAQGQQERAAREYRHTLAPSLAADAASLRGGAAGGGESGRGDGGGGGAAPSGSGGAGKPAAAVSGSSTVPEVVDFVIGRIIECYTDLADWAELDRCLTELEHAKSPAVSQAIGKHGVQLRRAAELAKFDGAALGAGSPLMASVSEPSDSHAGVGLTLSMRRRLQLSELCAAEVLSRSEMPSQHRHNLLIEERDALMRAAEGLIGGNPTTSLTRSVVRQLQALTALAGSGYGVDGNSNGDGGGDASVEVIGGDFTVSSFQLSLSLSLSLFLFLPLPLPLSHTFSFSHSTPSLPHSLILSYLGHRRWDLALAFGCLTLRGHWTHPSTVLGRGLARFGLGE